MNRNNSSTQKIFKPIDIAVDVTELVPNPSFQLIANSPPQHLVLRWFLDEN
jgi:hypothetical protein